jgi:hypothetical protein
MKTKENKYFHPDVDAKCPYCHGEMRGAVDPTGAHEDGPHTGDLAICAYCGKPSRFNEELVLVEIDQEDFNDAERLLIALSQDLTKRLNARYFHNN